VKKLAEGSAVIWRELDPAHVPGDGEPRFVDRGAIVCRHGRDAGGTYTEIEVDDGRVVQVHRDSLRPAPIACAHPEHRLGTHGRLKRNQRVCLTCGAVVVVRR
jgi:hypothetical protein